MAETGPGAEGFGNCWEEVTWASHYSRALDVLGLGLRHKHSPGPLAFGLLTMNVANPRKWRVMGIRPGTLTRGRYKNTLKEDTRP